MNPLKNKNYRKYSLAPKVSFFAQEKLSPDEASSHFDLAKSGLLSDKKVLGQYQLSDKSFFSKSLPLSHRNNRLRATFFLKRRGTYDWPIAEIYNNLSLNDTKFVPEMLAYGYRRNNLGFITKALLITEWIPNTCSLTEFLKNNPEKQEFILNQVFDAFEYFRSKSFLHLDLWANNILVDLTHEKVWIIDLEMGLCTSHVSKEEYLGYSLAYLHYLYDGVPTPKSDYTEFFKKWAQKSNDIDIQKLLENFNFFYEKKLTKKLRFAHFNSIKGS